MFDWFTSPSLKFAEDAEVLCDVLLVITTFLVVVGLIGELKKGASWAKWHPIFEMLVLLGVAGEMLFEGGAFWFSLRARAIEDVALEDAKAATQHAEQETERLKQAVGWRIVSESAQLRIADALPKSGGSIRIIFGIGDPEAFLLSAAISHIFDAANRLDQKTLWKTEPDGRFFTKSMPYGVHIMGRNEALVSAMRQAFSSENIPFLVDDILDPSDQSVFIGSGGSSDVLILVGARRPLF